MWKRVLCLWISMTWEVIQNNNGNMEVREDRNIFQKLIWRGWLEVEMDNFFAIEKQ